MARRYGVKEMCDALAVASADSVNPAALGPHTRVSGEPLLALTSCGRSYGTTPGALSI